MRKDSGKVTSEREVILIVIFSLAVIAIISLISLGIFLIKSTRELSPEEIASIVSVSSCHENQAIDKIKKNGALMHLDSKIINKNCLKEKKG